MSLANPSREAEAALSSFFLLSIPFFKVVLHVYVALTSFPLGVHSPDLSRYLRIVEHSIPLFFLPLPLPFFFSLCVVLLAVIPSLLLFLFWLAGKRFSQVIKFAWIGEITLISLHFFFFLPAQAALTSLFSSSSWLEIMKEYCSRHTLPPFPSLFFFLLFPGRAEDFLPLFFPVKQRRYLDGEAWALLFFSFSFQCDEGFSEIPSKREEHISSPPSSHLSTRYRHFSFPLCTSLSQIRGELED